jgi:hypothetical protein
MVLSRDLFMATLVLASLEHPLCSLERERERHRREDVGRLEIVGRLNGGETVTKNAAVWSS